MRAGAGAGRARNKNFLSGLLNIDPMRLKQACARTSMLQRACGTRATPKYVWFIQGICSVNSLCKHLRIYITLEPYFLYKNCLFEVSFVVK